ncbi:uncharacterized protein LOC129004717 [Macrosteles quadrilineatus]|uniref:uncharacterized protein LOC129004717 n=1 Tax=Macrosteles quadrilineatus TaxID=74068 RepID=UPI0023E258D5|nr:uncharacterized protein LOC129004717 [Macrosteles quadrilineatus]
MMTQIKIKMLQCSLFISCLLAFGGGSGLTGLSTFDRKTTTGSPNTPGPPVASSVSPSLGYHHSQNLSLVNLTLPLTSPVSSTSSPPDNIWSTTEYDSLPLTFSTSSVTTRTLEDATPTPAVTQNSGTPSTTGHPSNTITQKAEHKNNTKEQEQTVSLKSSKEWFIRRKHKGPYFEKRVKKLSATLRSPEFRVGNKQRKFNISQTTPDLVEFPWRLAKKNDVRPQMLKSDSKIQNARDTEYPLRSTRNSSRRVNSEEKQRKRPIAMGIPASSTVLLAPTPSSPSPVTVGMESPQDSDEYYSSYGEYPDVPLIGYNSSGYAEAAVLPDPEVEVEEEDVEPEVEIPLPDDSLADTDLHDHDLIDSVMYIYFGSSERDERGAGRQVLIVGAVISLVAQFLTLVSVLRRLHSHPSESASLILLNAELALTAGNLVFMLGVQATGSKRSCEFVAVTLHYLHLVTSCWFLVNSVFSYLGLHRPEARRRLRPWWLAAWFIPAVVVVASVMFNRRGYETRSFCWMSVARGMLYSFMVPVAILILLNTCLAVLGLRQLSLSDKTDDVDRKSMRVSATLLPVFAVVWFLGVVALENSVSLVFPLMFVASSGFLNWFVLACWLPADLSLWRESDEDYEDDDDDIYEEVLKTPADSQPLLEDSQVYSAHMDPGHMDPHMDLVYSCGRRDPCDLQMDPICTISGYSTQLHTI